MHEKLKETLKSLESGYDSKSFRGIILLIVFELLTSTKIGDLMKAKREYGYR
jgi:hypothetical protein